MRAGHLRWRRHWKAPVAFVLLVGVLLVAGTGIRVSPVVSAGGSLPPREAIENITNDIDLFDNSIVHRIDVQIDPDDRARMLEAYREDGEKIVVPATVTIDGVEISGAGIRLKGNSSLWGVGGEGELGPDGEPIEGDGGFVGGPGGGDWEAFDAAFNECMDDQGLGDMFSFGAPPGGADGFDPDELPEGAIVMGPDGEFPQDGFPGGDDFGGFPQTLHSATGDDFAAPYLIVINHSNEQLRYQGLSQIALRTDGNGTILAEAVTVAAYAAAGLPAPQVSMTGLRINNGDELLYGVSSILDQDYIDRHFGGADGALFKATAQQSQDFSYEGEDQSKYPGFEQVTATKRHDKSELIELLRFTQNATAAEFAEGLGERVDIDALARLLAINNLLVNTDSLGTGPGGNYYLFHDATNGRFVPLGWDFNYSLGGLDGFNAQLGADPLDGGFGGGFDPGFETGDGELAAGDGGGTSGGGIDAAFSYCDAKAAEATGMEDMIFGAAGGPGDGEFLDENGDPIDPEEMFGSNRLVERFMETPAFAARYDDVREELAQALFGSGQVAETLRQQIATVNAALSERESLAPSDILDTQNESLTRFVEERSAHVR